MKRQTFLRFCALTALLCMQAYTLVAADVYSLSVAKQPRMTIKTVHRGIKTRSLFKITAPSLKKTVTTRQP